MIDPDQPPPLDAGSALLEAYGGGLGLPPRAAVRPSSGGVAGWWRWTWRLWRAGHYLAEAGELYRANPTEANRAHLERCWIYVARVDMARRNRRPLI